MNVVLDDAEEVWTKTTKSKKQGDRNHLGSVHPLACTFDEVVLMILTLRTTTAQGREYHANSTGIANDSLIFVLPLFTSLSVVRSHPQNVLPTFRHRARLHKTQPFDITGDVVVGG